MDAETVGWIAAALTLLAFSQRSMLPLRIAAIGSNLSFIGYGVMAHLHPVMALHLLLLPCNAFRLTQLLVGSDHRDSSWQRTGRSAIREHRRAELQRQICQPLTAAMLCSQMLVENVDSGPERDAVRSLADSLGSIEEIVLLLLREGGDPDRPASRPIVAGGEIPPTPRSGAEIPEIG